MSKAERVNDIFRECLFNDDEAIDGQPPANAIIVQGLTARFGFHPERIEKNKTEIEELLSDFHDNFYSNTGGGWSFLNFCETKNGEQWTGLHYVMEMLVALGIAVNKVSYLMPKEMWKMMPGGMPYIVIQR